MAKNEFIIESTLNAQSTVNEFNKILSQGVGALEQLQDKAAALAGKKITFTPAIRYEVDANGLLKPVAYLKEQGNILKDIYALQERLNKVQQGSVTNLRQTLNYYKQQRDETVKITATVDQYGRKIQAINPAWDAANNKVRELARQLEIAGASNFWQKIKAELNLGPILAAGNSINNLVNTFQSLAIVIAAVQAPIRAFSQALNDIQQIDLTFKGIGGGPAEVAKVFADSSSIALKYGVNLKTVREGFQQLTPVILASGGTLDNVSQIIGALSSRFVTFGLSAEKSKRVMNGVIQAFGKGKLMAEELTQQISEADPAFKTDLANAINVTVRELTEMVKAGDVTTDKLLEWLPLLEKNSSMFGKLGTSATSAVAALGRGQATIEQVKNQLATLSQLNLEAFARLFEPLVGAFLQIEAATVDFVTNLRQLESIQFAIDFINSLAQELAALYTIFTNGVSIVLKIIDPIFLVINALNQLKIPFTEIGIVSGTLAAIIVGNLIKAMIGLAGTVIPVVTASMGQLITSFGATATAMGTQFLAAIGKAVTGIGTYLANAAVTVIGNAELTASYNAVAAAIAKKAAAQAADTGGDAVQLALDLGGANAQLAKETAGAAAATEGLTGAVGLSAAAFATIAAILVVAAVAMDQWNQENASADKLNKDLKSDLDEINKKYANLSKSTLTAAEDTKRFKAELEELTKITRQRNLFEIAIDYVFNSDMDVAISIYKTTEQLRKEFGLLEQEANSVANEIRAYSAAQDESGAAGERLAQSINKQVEKYDAIIQRAIEAREKEKQRALETGKGIDGTEKRQLESMQRVIDGMRKKRDELIKESNEKGIDIRFKVSDEEIDAAASTIDGLKGVLKGLQEEQTTLRFGEQGTEEVGQKIRGLQGLLQYIESDTYTVNIKAQFDLDKASLKGSLDVAQALFDNIKARSSLEGSIFDIYKARGSYATKAEQEHQGAIEKRLQKELESLKDRGAGQEVIKAKEAEINKVKEEGEKRIQQLRDAERAIEIQAQQAKVNSLGTVFKAEEAVLGLKQSQERLEADMGVLTAQNVKLEAEKAVIIAEQNLLKARQNNASQKEIAAAEALVGNAKQYLSNAEKGVQAAQTLRDKLAQSQAIERDTLKIQQAATTNAEKAKLEMLGIRQNIEGVNGSMGQYGSAASAWAGSTAGVNAELSGTNGQLQSLAGNVGNVAGSFREVSGGVQGVTGSMNALISSAKVGIDEAGNLYTILSQDPTDPLAVGLSQVAGTLYNIEKGSSDAYLELAQLSNGFVSASGKLALIPGGFIAAGKEGLAEWERAVAMTAGYIGGVAAELPLTAVRTSETDESVANIKRVIEQIGTNDPIRVSAQLELEGSGMDSSSVQSITDNFKKYAFAVDDVNRATAQLGQAQQQYNEALATGDPGALLTAAGYVRQTQEALDAANFNLDLASENYAEATTYAKQLGISTQGIADGIYGISQETINLINGQQGYQTSVETSANSMLNLAGNVATTTNQTGALVEAIGEVDGSLSDLSGSAEGVGGGFDTASEQAGGLYEAASQITTELGSEAISSFPDSFEEASSNAAAITSSGFDDAATSAASAGGEFSSSLSGAATEADNIYSTLSAIDGLNPTVTVNVTGTPGRFAGGPVDPGSLYRVNELGKEAFLSASGRLSMINRPKNALWRAPSAGTVIPAHLAASLDIPGNGVKVASGASRRVSTAISGMSSSASMARAFTQALRASGLLEVNNNTAVNQAGQAVQLGKLTHAVNKLVDKDWNVQVNVKNPSPSSYVNMINRLS